MTDVLKGNFTAKKEVSVNTEQKEGLEERFEREATKRLGGSIAFVSRKKVMWSEDEQD